MASGPADPVVPNALMAKSITISGGALFNYMVTRDELPGHARDVFQDLAEAWLKLHVHHARPSASCF
jgi:NADPH:quinone reductase